MALQQQPLPMDFSTYGLTPPLLQMPAAILHPAFLSQLQLHNTRHYASSIELSSVSSDSGSENSSGGLEKYGEIRHDRESSSPPSTGRHNVIVRNECKRKKDQVKDEAYWERRRKNNDAAKRSRDTRRQKEDEMAARAVSLEHENVRLRLELDQLRAETDQLRAILLAPTTLKMSLLHQRSPTNFIGSSLLTHNPAPTSVITAAESYNSSNSNNNNNVGNISIPQLTPLQIPPDSTTQRSTVLVQAMKTEY